MAGFIGLVQSCYLAIPVAQLFCRELNFDLSKKSSWTGNVRLSRQSLRDLDWWWKCIETVDDTYQDGFLKSTHTLRAQKCVSKRIIPRNTAPPVPFLAPIRSATAGRALTRRAFVDRVATDA